MFGLFKKKSEIEKLQEKYDKLMEEYNRLSKINRREADAKFVEAETVAKQIDALIEEKNAKG